MNGDLVSLLQQGLPAFANNILRAFDPAQFGMESHLPSASVDLGRVVGVEHRDYQNRRWIDLLGNPPGSSNAVLKRSARALSETRGNPMYYLSSSLKSNWSFYQLGTDFYISEGVHRTVVGRFLLTCNGRPPIVHGVGVTVLTRNQTLGKPVNAAARFGFKV